MANQTREPWLKTFVTIAIGQAVSLVGSSAVQFAIIWWLASSTGSPLIMGIAGLAAYLPMAVFGPLAGVLADRHDRKVICMLSDLSSGVVALVFAVIILIFSPPVEIILAVLFLRGSVGAFQQPAYQAMTPQYIPEEELVRVGGWTQVIASASFLLGPVLGATLTALLPLWVILLTDLIGAVFACIMLWIAKVPKLDRSQAESQTSQGSQAKSGFFSELKEGFAIFTGDKSLFIMLVSSIIGLLFYLPLASFYPLMTSDYFNATAWHASAVEVAFAIGMLISAALFGSVIKVKKHLAVSYWGFIGVGAMCIICGVVPPTMTGWVIFAISLAIMGAFSNVNSVPFVAYLQLTVDPLKMGRAFSVISIVSSVTMPVGLAIAGPVADVLGVNVWFLVAGIAIVLVCGVALFLNNKIDHAAPVRESEDLQ